MQTRRTYLTTPTERNRYAFIRNTCNGPASNPLPEMSSEEVKAVTEEAKTLGAICDNGLCAKKAGADGAALLKCARCGWAMYCSKACQKLCWKRHKVVCVSVYVDPCFDLWCCVLERWLI